MDLASIIRQVPRNLFWYERKLTKEIEIKTTLWPKALYNPLQSFSLNFICILGQITSFAQEVLSEGVDDEEEYEDVNPKKDLEAAKEKINELNNLISTQDNEVCIVPFDVYEFSVLLA